ncbi:MAG: DUF4932 domain-containing protein [Planctomycetes bacterium]|nr:DUF4932 domain-containing protein [Planctomycetota bacterium]
MSKNRVSQIIKAFIVPVVMLAFSIGLSSSALAADNQPAKNIANVGKITIEVDPRVELIGIVFRLAGNPRFTLQQLGIAAHEFCHSFTNPVVDKYMDRLQPAGEKLFAVQSQAMRMRGYQEWESMMYETAVRACVGSFVRNSFETMHSDYYQQREISHGFLWIKDLTDLLRKYEANRDKYPTFESFFPEFVAFFNDYSGKMKF